MGGVNTNAWSIEKTDNKAAATMHSDTVARVLDLQYQTYGTGEARPKARAAHAKAMPLQESLPPSGTPAPAAQISAAKMAQNKSWVQDAETKLNAVLASPSKTGPGGLTLAQAQSTWNSATATTHADISARLGDLDFANKHLLAPTDKKGRDANLAEAASLRKLKGELEKAPPTLAFAPEGTEPPVNGFAELPPGVDYTPPPALRDGETAEQLAISLTPDQTKFLGQALWAQSQGKQLKIPPEDATAWNLTARNQVRSNPYLKTYTGGMTGGDSANHQSLADTQWQAVADNMYNHEKPKPAKIVKRVFLTALATFMPVVGGLGRLIPAAGATVEAAASALRTRTNLVHNSSAIRDPGLVSREVRREPGKELPATDAAARSRIAASPAPGPAPVAVDPEAQRQAAFVNHRT